jgi:superfamily II DNA or RNA helicase
MTQIQQNEQVFHTSHGMGRVAQIQPDGLVLVEFTQGGFLRVAIEELQRVDTPSRRAAEGRFDAPLEVLARLQAHAIQSVHRRWGVFARSRIQLLPHQLWTCQKVMSTWPPRWLVADDVGLGKTVEAGLILQSAKAQGRLNRFLVLCPAGLVDQWRQRLLTMFEIRCEAYSPASDGPKDDYWGGDRRQVIASFHTLRDDVLPKSKGDPSRWDRLCEAPPFDLVIFDEAHHMGSDESATTLAYRFLERLQDRGRVKGLILFTGTPHKGKDFAFLNLMSLLRPGQFNPKAGLEAHLHLLPQVMIRNAKNLATDLQGQRLFHGSSVQSRTFGYSQQEQDFYDRLTLFIEAGLLFSGTLGDAGQRAVGLVLASLQKLAASSVAAIERAIQNRLRRLQENQGEEAVLRATLKALGNREDLDGDALASMEERLVELSAKIDLVQNEQPRLEELLRLAGEVHSETKLEAILDLVKNELDGRSVLFFTEYKATQSLLLSRLIQTFGESTVGFINGDGRAEGVGMPNGTKKTFTATRENTASAFNDGKIRFLVSTEAAGEGIDLQRSCHTLVHVDLPWNPMRLHQRVGRLYRYGQLNPVEVFKFHNPGTVESRIHRLLEAKLHTITQAFGEVMDDPEDMLQMVLGMTDPSYFQMLFQKGSQTRGEGLDTYLERLGGGQIVQTVRTLLGNTACYDFQGVGAEVPQVDLPALKPFFQVALALHGREWLERGVGGSFIAPKAWRTDPWVQDRYDNLVFERGHNLVTTLGADHKVFQTALKEALRGKGTLGVVEGRHLPRSVQVFRLFQQVAPDTAPPDRVVGLMVGPRGWELCLDWELIKLLNPIAEAYRIYRPGDIPPNVLTDETLSMEGAEEFLRAWNSDSPLRMEHLGVEWLGGLLGIQSSRITEAPVP